ncbi:Zinc finger protein 350 [Liparis tanakae]|uniref:Zinc finger protein 350 n=1 Tax=Liparis tanakae TaxID=230148 RepID=A0A4Z2EZS4_9TELE|nr:Zinc finger protein 350 [Liparis tanakae]
MSDFMPSNESPAAGARPASANWGVATGMDQITVVRIDDTHIAEERSHAGGRAKAAYYDMDYSMPEEEEQEEEKEEEGEEDGVYVIEYSNPEEEGESYQFTMSVDRSLPALKRPAAPQSPAAPPPAKPSRRPRQKRKSMAEEEEEEEEEKRPLVSNMCILELGEPDGAASTPPGRLRCSLCPPPGRTFKRASGLAVHQKHLHFLEGNKTFYCTTCRQPVRTQAELDAHTKRHANRGAAFTCTLCPAPAPTYRGSRIGLKSHLSRQHAGVVPRCRVCDKGFGSLDAYLADQFRHVGVSPFFCGRCRIYEMTERGLDVHVRNHGRKERRKEEKERKLKEEEEKREEKKEEELPQESGGSRPQTLEGDPDNSSTDDSDF